MSNSGPGALELHCHEVTVRFLERAVVPPYEGSMIRGAFGRSFKESCCPFPHDGNGCPLEDKCPFSYVFETSPPEGAAEYAGAVQEFLPLLGMGQLTHVGKRAVFGLGRYRMESA